MKITKENIRTAYEAKTNIPNLDLDEKTRRQFPFNSLISEIRTYVAKNFPGENNPAREQIHGKQNILNSLYKNFNL